MTKFFLRQMRPDDSARIAALYERAPDTGRIALRVHYKIDPYLALVGTQKSTIGVVAESENATVVGAGVVKLSKVRFQDHEHDAALLGNLVVHPDHRGNGIATALAHKRIEIARENCKGDVIILAGIQEKNERSFAVAHKWLTNIVGDFQTAFIPLLRRNPGTERGVRIRRAVQEDFVGFANNFNYFYANYAFAPELSADSLAQWLSHSLIDRPTRHLYVAVDVDDKLLAGFAVAESYTAREIHVRNVPAWMGLVNRVVHVVPKDGIMRPLTVTRLWHVPGQASALQDAWNSIRFQYQDRANAVLLYYDPRSRLQNVLGIPFWLPKGKITLVAQTAKMPPPSSFIYPPV
jgi:predicted N-acetyltransferase YhbS